MHPENTPSSTPANFATALRDGTAGLSRKWNCWIDRKLICVVSIEGAAMPVGPILLITLTSTLVLLMIGSLPIWPYSVDWGYYPTLACGVVLLGLLLLLFLGRSARRG